MENENQKTDYLEEAPGERSLMRLMAHRAFWMGHFYAVFAIILFCLTGGEKPVIPNEPAMWAAFFALANWAFSVLGKNAAKIIENWNIKTPTIK